jgi:hypothetical protein
MSYVRDQLNFKILISKYEKLKHIFPTSKLKRPQTEALIATKFWISPSNFDIKFVFHHYLNIMNLFLQYLCLG